VEKLTQAIYMKLWQLKMDGPKKKLVTNFELVVIMRMTPYRIINNNCSGANTISHSRQGHGFLGVEVKRG
jgi:hypothetical protein